MTRAAGDAREVIEVGDFGSVVSADRENPTWVPAGFPVGAGEMWTYQEPDAVVVVQDGRLRVGAVPYTRHHDQVQILDNAKHMYFSTRAFAAPEGGRLRVEWTMAAQIVNARERDLYDGFVSFHWMDLSTGTAIDLFASNEIVATVYARLPFPGVNVPRPERGPRYFSLFDEFADRTRAGEPHAYAIAYDRGAGVLEWFMDGERLKRETRVPDIGAGILALGLMTEKDLVPDKGSVSCHGQGAVGTWSDIRVTLEAP
ncbi:MAG: DUF6081 family protein [Proteobacteria bacterium]|nr:DUF6081 family protein [Pseudomonadota bacterium]